MRLRTAPVLSSVIAASCSEEQDNTPQVADVVTIATEQPAGPALQPFVTFSDVLANPGAIPVNHSARYEPKGTYSYAFADFTADADGDGVYETSRQSVGPTNTCTHWRMEATS